MTSSRDFSLVGLCPKMDAWDVGSSSKMVAGRDCAYRPGCSEGVRRGGGGDVLPALGEPRCGGHADCGCLDPVEQRDDQQQSVYHQRPDGDELPETVLLVQHAVRTGFGSHISWIVGSAPGRGAACLWKDQ